ncbi:MAG: hypothetical protein RL885_20100 [Planctomycetota bacterium]
MSKSYWRAVGPWALLLAVGLLPRPLEGAQDNDKPPVPTQETSQQQSTGAGSEARVSINVRDRDLKDVVAYLREKSGANIVVAESIDETVTLEFSDVPWRQALDLVADEADCLVVEVGGGVLRIEQPERVTFAFEDADITKVIDAISKISGANIVISPEVRGSINLRLTKVPWRYALDTAVKTLGYVVVEEEGNILTVVPPSALVEQLETRTFRLRFVRPPDAYVATIKTSYAVGDPKPPTQDPEKDFPLLEAVRTALSDNGELNYVPRKNILIVKDTKPVLDRIDRLIGEIDVEPAQVLVDVKFITTSNTDLMDFGLDIGQRGLVAGLSMGQIPTRLPFNLGEGGFDDVLIANDGNQGPYANLTDQNAGNTVVPDTIFGALSFTDVNLALRILKRDVRSEVIQAPKIFALDNQSATIFVGEEVRFAEAQAQQGQAGGLELVVREARNSPVQTGFQLYIIPHIVPGTDRIVMTVIPTQQALTGTSPNLPGFDEFRVGSGSGEGTIFLPRVGASTLVTRMMLEDGHTGVIGGLMTDRDIETITKVPILGDIPLLGWLFKNKVRNIEKRSLIVFITPRIIRSSDETQRMIDSELRARLERIERERNNIFGPEGNEDDSSSEDGEDN